MNHRKQGFKTSRPILRLFFVAAFVSTQSLYAQDCHYNSVQIGARSVLMGGAVIGNLKDNTAVYYNPAALAFIDTSNISLNGNAYQINNIRIFNALGEKKDYTSTQLGSNPLFLGGMISKPKQRLKIGYSVMSNVDFNFKATARLDEYAPIVDFSESPGDEEFIGQGSINTKLDETVFAIGGGYKISREWSVGLTNMIVIRSNYYTRVTYSRFFLNDADHQLVSSSFSRTADYYNVRYVPKLAVNYRKTRFSAGMTVQLPSVNIMGTGSISADVLAQNIMYQGNRSSLLANDRQTKLKTKYKSPLGISGGANYIAKRSAIGVAIEYYAPIDVYYVIQAENAPFVRPASLYPELGADEFLKVATAAVPVVNFAVGYEYAVRNQLIVTGSYRYNGSFYDESLENTVAIKTEIASWPIHHFTLGTTFLAGRSRLTLGLLYSYGKDNGRKQNGYLEDPIEGNYLQGKTTITKATYNSIGILLGYTFGLQGKI